MVNYQIIQPSTLLAPYVKHYWFLTTNSPTQACERIIPDGLISLMFHRGERIFSSAHNHFQPQSFLSGQTTSYSDLFYSGSICLVCIVFQPVGVKAFFNMPLIELNGQNISADDLEDQQLLDLQNRLLDTSSIQASVLLIEQFLVKRLCVPAEYNQRRINAVLQSIYSGEQNVDILAQTACLSYKQFKRIFTEYVGAKPKEYLRVVRFQRALSILQKKPNTSFEQLTYECGYYDQSHLIKEFNFFSGYTPMEYLAICLPYSDYFS